MLTTFWCESANEEVHSGMAWMLIYHQSDTFVPIPDLIPVSVPKPQGQTERQNKSHECKEAKAS